MRNFTMEYWKDDGWFVGRLTEVPGVFSQGETIEELKENIVDAYKMMIDSEPVPSMPSATSKTIVEIAGGN
ncbi:MAG: type II toxin-antitoxin system HicB family antitoxin [Candidatus Wallbacteria bacterium]|nr:type II toxin-antitoxin system HicB family antitoxin [Candidatus Wallbacteria bacterium]